MSKYLPIFWLYNTQRDSYLRVFLRPSLFLRPPNQSKIVVGSPPIWCRLRATRRFLVLLLAAASLRCGNGDLESQPEIDPAAITVMGGEGQTGVVGEALSDPFVIRVTDVEGNPVPGHAVTISMVAGGPGALVAPTATTTDVEGRAVIRGTLAQTAGPWAAEARVTDRAGRTLVADLSATATAAQPDSLFPSTGQDQAGRVASPLSASLVVTAIDRFGNPAAGVEVHWATTGGGSVSHATTSTDANGRTEVVRTLGSTVGPQAAVARVTGLKGSPVTFHHVASAGLPAKLKVTTQPSSSTQSGQPFARQPIVEVRDETDNLVDGVSVEASLEPGDGLLSGTTRVTAHEGVATFTDLAIFGAGQNVLRFRVQSASVASRSVTVLGPEAITGKWAGVISWPIVAVHLAVLPDGRVLSMGKADAPQIWDPETGIFTAVPSPAWLFCSGHAFLADGRLLVIGGHIDDAKGLPDATIFDYRTGSWSQGPPMAQGRWYPTATTLATGEILALAGTDSSGTDVVVPEIWKTGVGWRQLTGAALRLAWYPRVFLAPNGKVFSAGPSSRSRYLTTTGDGTWSNVTRMNANYRHYGSAVMYEPGKILAAGGGDSSSTLPQNSAETIDLNKTAPTWRSIAPMAFSRQNQNATLLPTGEVLMLGGTSIGFNDPAGSVHAAEVWNPTTGAWTTLASNTITRMYHSTAVLLPDGRVLHTGSGEGQREVNQRNAEIFSPPYMFKGSRPTIATAPAGVSYGETFNVQSPEAEDITEVTWVRLGATTHAFDENQRFNRLKFTVGSSGLSVRAPADPNLAPPGHYMMFILDGEGVPSRAKIVHIE